ncbi:MAG: TldD/PmbA family protein [Clostridia bacterium]|nr:TldD/PmbA family protein [Clostridia bacterium]
MKAPFSPYLTALAPRLKELLGILRADYDQVSALATDSAGFAVQISQRAKTVRSETMMTERGVVIRVCRNGQYSEAAFNDFDPADMAGLAERIRGVLAAQEAVLRAVGTPAYATPLQSDEPLTLFWEAETGRLPEDEDIPALIGRLSAISDRGMAEGRDMIDCAVRAQSTHVCKMFLSEHRDLRQSYVISEGGVIAMVTRGGRTEMARGSVAERLGPEIFDDLSPQLAEALEVSQELLGAGRVEPGMYDIITAPDVSGLIAHEAFGHGVEMDMFVKERALGAQYIGKRVGSDRVTMHEGANCTVQVASYAFDDEGTLAGDVTEIDRGILRTGICDALSALRLGTAPTGNGKRENYAHKVYTRMTNTLFDSGDDSLEDMIASVKKGYLLRGVNSGMEDPKHWGIQCIVERGYEIIDGRLTGKVISPVVMTGYVPDLLGSVSMVSPDREAFGSGGCGKGHKEWVKVSDGGPYLKAKARLG